MSALEKPTIVNYAVGLLVAVVLLSLIYSLIWYKEFSNQLYKLSASDWIMELFSITFMLMYIFFVYKISDGRNWARITLLVLFFTNIYANIERLQAEYAINILLFIISSTQLLFFITGLILLFIPKSNDWFRELKKSRKIVHVKVTMDE